MGGGNRAANVSDVGRHDACVDVCIVGAGPAGAAAAIACANAGLQVTLFEQEAALWARPGDTLHPGVEPILRQLGVAQQLAGVTGLRHAGVWVEWGAPRRFQAYGSDQQQGHHAVVYVFIYKPLFVSMSNKKREMQKGQQIACQIGIGSCVPV